MRLKYNFTFEIVLSEEHSAYILHGENKIVYLNGANSLYVEALTETTPALAKWIKDINSILSEGL